MKVFTAIYRWTGSYGAYDDRDYIVVANTANEALDFILAQADDTVAEYWTIEEVPTTEPITLYISSAHN